YLYVCRFLSRLSEACTAPEAKEALRHRAGQIALSVARNIPAYGLQGTVREDATAFLKEHLEELTAFAMGSGSASLKAQGWFLRCAPSVYLGLYGGLRRLRARSKPR
ncbi:MAG: hypothetical protein IJ175_10235, partial [Clostridia bacterium]|nr:hypothetical protein [Clostridia bacterium]